MLVGYLPKVRSKSLCACLLSNLVYCNTGGEQRYTLEHHRSSGTSSPCLPRCISPYIWVVEGRSTQWRSYAVWRWGYPYISSHNWCDICGLYGAVSCGVFYYPTTYLINLSCRIACILGHSSGFPCPICLVPRLEQCQLVGDWPIRTVLDSQNLLVRADDAPTLEKRHQILLEQSLREVEVSYTTLAFRSKSDEAHAEHLSWYHSTLFFSIFCDLCRSTTPNWTRDIWETSLALDTGRAVDKAGKGAWRSVRFLLDTLI